MKKHILSLLLAAGLLTACGDSFLDKKPSTQLPTSEAITTLDDVKHAVDGLYSLMASTYYYNASMFLYGDLKADDMQATSWAGGTVLSFYNYEHSTDVPNDGGLWGRPYYIVRNAWNIIEAMDAGKITDATAEEMNDYRGQALAAIALAHFDMTRVFGYSYAKDNGASWGVAIVDHAIGDDEHPNRSTVADCYQFVIDRLKEAIPLLSTDKHDGHINAYAARALLARAYLYCERNEEAYDTADELIRELEANGLYSLASNEDYLAQFDLDNKFGQEALFQIANTTSSNPGRDGISYLYHWWGQAYVLMTTDFMDFIRQDPDDVRAGIVATCASDRASDVILKYPGTAFETPSNENNYTVVRLSEVYLIAAEAGVKAGGSRATGGLAYLNRIVERGNPANTVAEADYTLDRVLDERRRELVGEGHRYFDMLRNGRTIYRSGGNHLMGTPAEVNWDYEKCILPIDRDQFTFCPDMPQNPGYLK